MPGQAHAAPSASDLSGSRDARFGLVFATISAAGYGLNIVTAQIASTVGIGGALIVFWRVALILGALAILVLAARKALSVEPGERGALIVFGLASSVVGTAYVSSVAFLPVSVAVVLFYLFPVVIVLAEPLVERTPMGLARPAIVLVAFAGVAMVVGPDLHSLDPRGLVLVLIAVVGAAVQFFAGARMPRTDILPKLFWGHVLVLPGVLAVLAVTGGFHGPAIVLAAPVAVAVTLGSYALSIALQLMALTRIPAAVAGLTFCAEPLFASLFAAIILGERLSGLQYGGGLVVVLAIAANAALLMRTRR